MVRRPRRRGDPAGPTPLRERAQRRGSPLRGALPADAPAVPLRAPDDPRPVRVPLPGAGVPAAAVSVPLLRLLMLYVSVDIESDGPIPGDFSMISLGAVVVEPGLARTFAARFRPISDRFQPEALAVSGHSREETLTFPPPAPELARFAEWLAGLGARVHFLSDNNGFDWQFVNWYFHHFLGHNPFGHSSTNLGSLYKGLVKNTFENFKHLRVTPHTHDPLDDARGNAEALLRMGDELGLRFGAQRRAREE